MVFHLSLAVPILPMGFLYLESKHNDWSPVMQHDTRVYISCFIAAIILLAYAYSTYRKNVMIVQERSSVKDRFTDILPVYQKLYLGNLLAALLLCVGYYLTGAGLLIGTYLIQLFALSFLRPYADRYIRDLKLSKEEAKLVRKKTLIF